MKKIAVIGGGIVGMATALFLKDHFDVTLFEKQEVSKRQGAGSMLQPSGLFVLKELGLHKQIIERGTIIEGFFGENVNGSIDFDISFKDHKSGIYGLGVHRGSVFYELLKAVDSSNIDFKTGAEILDFFEEDKKTILKSEYRDYLGFDIVIVANGARSLMRKHFNNFSFVKESKQGAIWSKIDSVGIELPNKIHQIYNKTERMLGLMPIGYERTLDEKPKLNFFFGTSLKYINNWETISLETWKKDVLEISKEYAPYLEQITDKSQLVCAPYHDVSAKKYHHKNFVFIGDAAHAMGPHLSSGTNLGLLDAYFLSKELMVNIDYKTVFKNYEKKRRGQLIYYQTVSRIITPYFQSDIDRSFVRNHVMKYLYKIPLIKDIMVETITGRRFNLLKRLPSKFYLSKENR